MKKILLLLCIVFSQISFTTSASASGKTKDRFEARGLKVIVVASPSDLVSFFGSLFSGKASEIEAEDGGVKPEAAVAKAESEVASVDSNAIQFDLTRISYPYYSKIIVQTKPQVTITFVEKSSYNDYDEEKAERLRLEFSRFLERECLLKRYITRNHDREDHSLLEHFGCDDPYIDHFHLELEAFNGRVLYSMIGIFELTGYQEAIGEAFSPLL